MNFIDSISMFFIMLALALVPSASVTLVITRSATLGLSNGIFVVAGIVLGDLVFILLAIFGLSVVAEKMGLLFLIIRYIGAVYLIWLGFTLLTSKNEAVATLSKTTKKGSLIASFSSGFFLTLGDIKAMFFYVSLFPAFIDLETLNLLDLVIVSSVTIIAVGGVKIFYAYSANKIVSASKGLKFENSTKKITGGLMVGVGSYLIAKA